MFEIVSSLKLIGPYMTEKFGALREQFPRKASSVDSQASGLKELALPSPFMCDYSMEQSNVIMQRKFNWMIFTYMERFSNRRPRSGKWDMWSNWDVVHVRQRIDSLIFSFCCCFSAYIYFCVIKKNLWLFSTLICYRLSESYRNQQMSVALMILVVVLLPNN